MNSKHTGLRVLVIEDSPVIAMATAHMLRALGHIPLGPAGNMTTATALVGSEKMDAAIVDLNIRGTKAFSLLSVLNNRGIPFLIASGYADWNMPEEWLGRVRLQKPFSEAQLQAKLTEIMQEN